MIKYFIIPILCCIGYNTIAQQVYNHAVIDYSRKINQHKSLDFYNGEWVENVKKNISKYSYANFTLSISPEKSIYKKSAVQPEKQNTNPNWNNDEESDDITIIKNFKSDSITIQKNFLDKKILINDSLPKINWKLTNEFRKIADYNCRKATAIVLDSIYLIAFYTDALTPSTGPLNTNGLPGTILGLVIPRLNVTYFATKVTPLLQTNEQVFSPTLKGDKYTFETLINKMNKSLDDWGKKWRSKLIWEAQL